MNTQELIKQILEMSGLSKAKLARMMLVSQPSLYFWESGRNSPQKIYICVLLQFHRKLKQLELEEKNIKNEMSILFFRFTILGMPYFLEWLYKDNS